MTPHEFKTKWKHHALTERASAQEHFLDICRMLGHPTPAEDDPKGERFTFEKGVPKTGGGDGFADVWKRGYFAWEYKKRRRNLDEALVQLVRYASALENPPLQVVCDTIRFKIVTAWTNVESKTYEFEIEDLDDPEKLGWLHALLHDPEKLKPARTRQKLTADAADKFQTISDRLQGRHADRREDVAHFMNQLVFCFFANSVKLLPDGLLTKLLRTAQRRPEKSKDYIDKLFEQMETGGEFDLTDIAHFNGGLFDGRRAFALNADDLSLLDALARNFDWSLIDPTIFGTLFERFLDPDKRAQIGAHYTDAEKIGLIVEPVVLRPLRDEWQAAKAEIDEIMAPVLVATAPHDRHGKAQLSKAFEAAAQKATLRRDTFVDRLTALRILDPACGSGNFLYLALQGVKDIEHRAISECEVMGLARPPLRVGPGILRGIEINPFAAELARTTIWIGHIQWSIKNAVYLRPNPILEKLDGIECRNALVDEDGTEADWPPADLIIGNPPFLGATKFVEDLGRDSTDKLRLAYDGRVPRSVDLVAYWFFKASKLLKSRTIAAFGLIATSAIRAGNNLKFMHKLEIHRFFFEAYSDEPWTVEGASVRVSLICASVESRPRKLDGTDVGQINSDLTGFNFGGFALAAQLSENADVSFQGSKKTGDFEIEGVLARHLVQEPLNINGRPNADVIKRSWLSTDFMWRDRDAWIIDFGINLDEAKAAEYEAPFKIALEKVQPKKSKNNRPTRSKFWWRHGDPQPAMRAAIKQLPRYIVTPEVSSRRVFAFGRAHVLPDCKIMVIASESMTTFGILHSKFHAEWAI